MGELIMKNNPRELRISLKMTQKEFALACGLPQRTLENWEEGKNIIKPYEFAWLKYYAEHNLSGEE